MRSRTEVAKIRLRFEGRKPDQNQVPIETLTQVLNGMQKTVYLIAMQHEEIPIRRRAVPSGRIRQRYEVLCSPLETGSLVVPVAVGDPFSDLFAPEAISAVVDSLQTVGCAVASANFGDLVELIPDSLLRNRVIEAFRSMVPKSGTGWKLSVTDEENHHFTLTEGLHTAIKSFLARSAEDEAVQTVTGELIRIDFSERKVTILYPVTNRELNCFYDESIEELLLENRRQMIQVTGRVIVDGNDQPAKIIEVESISELDLSPFYLSVFQYPDRSLVLTTPTRVEPQMDETGQLICIENEDLGISVFARTREALLDELKEEIEILWCEYAKEKDEMLTDKALRLKKNLLANLREE